MHGIIVLVGGFLLDCLLGDPHNPWHPICLIGYLISFLEKKIRKLFPKQPKGEFYGGLVMVVLVLFISTAVPIVLLKAAKWIHPYLALVLEIIMCYQLLAARSLRDESMKVYHALHQHDIEGARKAVSMIVGRDTQRLDAAGIAKAAVETVAENASDGVIAPMVFIAIGGVPLGFFYKAVNTMDSMVGYKNEKYLYFGRAAAKLDDVVNYIPARISALLMIAVSFLPGKAYDGKGAWRIWRRDRRKHASPNSAQTEAVCAGSLGVQLAGDASYFGKIVKKPTIGDAHRPVEYEDIKRANGLLYRTAILCECLALIGLLWVG
jgi:adenosylcobinamide-phosphate synthase